MLRQRIDVQESLALPGAIPVRLDVHAPEPRPLANELEGAGFEATREQCPIQRYRGAAPGVVCVEMSDGMIALIPVHVDDHSVERTNARHNSTIAGTRAAGPLTA